MEQSADNTSLAAWSDILLTGHGAMDEEHREFISMVEQLQVCADADFAACLEAFHAHARAHFTSEDVWMADSEYPKGECHVEEHRAVLQSVDEVRALIKREAPGALAVGRRLADELARWFPAHVQYLDSALAYWIAKKSTGGKTVVIRRNVARTAQLPAES